MDIRLIDEVSENSSVGIAIRDLISTQLGNEQTLDATLRQIGFGSGGTLLIGGFVDEKLATMNAFTPQTFIRNKEKITGYQSGFSATGGEHRGKGYWPKLLNAGMDLLKDQGASFVFGFPNPISQPLFEKKLNFDTTQMWRIALPVLATKLIKFSVQRPAQLFEPDLLELMALKAEVHSGLITIDADGGRGFGKRRRIKGFQVMDIGGVSSDDGDLNGLINRLAKLAGAMLFKMEVSESNSLASGLYPRHPSRPVIFRSLGADLCIDDIGFVGGLSDDY